jgi:hypothetical protein
LLLTFKGLVRLAQGFLRILARVHPGEKGGFVVSMRSVGFATCALLALAAPALASGSVSSSLLESARPATLQPSSASQAADSWTATASMAVARAGATATRLGNGHVLVVGGEGDTAHNSTAELYDPATGTWIPAGTLNEPRTLHVAVRLADGRVLVAGGGWYSANAELYTP